MPPVRCAQPTESTDAGPMMWVRSRSLRTAMGELYAAVGLLDVDAGCRIGRN